MSAARLTDCELESPTPLQVPPLSPALTTFAFVLLLAIACAAFCANRVFTPAPTANDFPPVGRPSASNA